VDAVLLQAKHERFDVISAIDELVLSSFVTRNASEEDGISIIDIPLVTVLFGRKKLSVEPMKIEVDEDTELLRMLATSPGSSAQDLVSKIFKNAAKQIAAGTVRLSDVRPLLKFISSKIPSGWLLLSVLHTGRCARVGKGRGQMLFGRDAERFRAGESVAKTCRSLRAI
jgi:hypothetical protein